MDVRGLGTLVLDASVRTQNALKTEATRLSSGLRINNAADDPSGLAIAETLASKVAGLDQGVRQIQDAGNALTVAEGALQTVTDILQRMRSLVVSARSDLLSVADRNDVQAELTQLRLEIDRIAQNTSFNGRALLDGSASSASVQPARLLIPQNDGLAGGGTVLDTKIDPTQPGVTNNAQQFVQKLTVDSYDPVANTVTITTVIGSQDPSFGPTQTASLPVGNGTNFPLFGLGPPTPGFPTFSQNDQYGNVVLTFNIGTLTQADVGRAAIIISLPPQFKAAGSGLAVNSGDAEGSIVTVDIPAVSSVNLGVNQVALGDDLQNLGAEYRIDYAIETVVGIRAGVGAQTVSLQEAANAGNIASVNTQASESAIRDLNVGVEVTKFTRDQIATQFQSKLLADGNRLQQTYATLVAASKLG